MTSNDCKNAVMKQILNKSISNLYEALHEYGLGITLKYLLVLIYSLNPRLFNFTCVRMG